MKKRPPFIFLRPIGNYRREELLAMRRDNRRKLLIALAIVLGIAMSFVIGYSIPIHPWWM